MPASDERLLEIERVYARQFPPFVRVARAILGERERAVGAVQDLSCGLLRRMRVATGCSVELPCANDHFILMSEALYKPALKNLPYELVAYDGAGAEVARTRIFKSALSVR